jgi:hypothetical protein
VGPGMRARFVGYAMLVLLMRVAGADAADDHFCQVTIVHDEIGPALQSSYLCGS